jgi:hypothetical protein
MDPHLPIDDLSTDNDPPEGKSLRDSVYHFQLARAARLKAAATKDVDLSIRLREAVILHERKARQLKREEGSCEDD